LDLSRDFWTYTSLGYFQQKSSANEVGSSTMPHKINPIDFENAEGNLGIANALADHLAFKLPVSRLQRDLSDSTAMRNIGSIMGYAVLSYQALQKGLNKISANAKFIQTDLAERWEVLAEPIQTVMRRYGIADAYEQLKAFTRGKSITQQSMRQFIDQLKIPESAKKHLLGLTPENYIGEATELAKKCKQKSR
jgi:adenylosuccinate lyase